MSAIRQEFVAPLVAALLLLTASLAEAGERAKLFLSQFRVVYDSPLAAPMTLVGKPQRTREFSYSLFAAELVAYIAKEVLPDSPDEFYGNSNLSSTWSDSMAPTDHAFGDHCLEVIARIGDGLSANAPDEIPTVAVDQGPSFASVLSQGVAAAMTIREAYRAIDDAPVDRRSDIFSISPKVGSNKIAVSFTIQW